MPLKTGERGVIGNLSKNKLENDPRFVKRTEKARASIRAGKGIPWDEIEAEDDKRTEPSRTRRKKRDT
jgi:hypothetical protein